jgi:hypothetical protein
LTVVDACGVVEEEIEDEEEDEEEAEKEVGRTEEDEDPA